jgi:hypothetical protein
LKVEFSGYAEIMASIEKIKNLEPDLPELNRTRAEKFKALSLSYVKNNAVNLRPNSSLTKHVQRNAPKPNHNPLWMVGNMLNAMKIRAKTNYAECGYFANDPSKPSVGKLSWYTIARIQSSGYTVPLQGPKGQRVRNWFAYFHNVYFRKGKQRLKIPPRPFLKKSADLYRRSGWDMRIVQTFFKNRVHV